MLPNLPLFRTHQCPSHYAAHMATFNSDSCSSLGIEPTESLYQEGGSGRVVAGSSTVEFCAMVMCGSSCRKRNEAQEEDAT